MCAFCYAPLTNGETVCSEACDGAAWRLCPTTDGELWPAHLETSAL